MQILRKVNGHDGLVEELVQLNLVPVLVEVKPEEALDLELRPIPGYEGFDVLAVKLFLAQTSRCSHGDVILREALE